MSKEYENTNTVAIPDWASEFPQIAHYSTLQGLLGILATNQLWATHYSFLNDINEVKHGAKYIDDIYRKAIESSTDLNKNQREYLNNSEALRDLWLQVVAPNKNDQEFFFTSFCGIPNQTDNETRLGTDGLLSQWRGYGGNGGFAIVFDSLELFKSYRYFRKECKDHTEKDQANCSNCLKSFYANLFMRVNYDYNDSVIEEYEAYPMIKAFSEAAVLAFAKNDLTPILNIYKNSPPEHHEIRIRGIIALLILQKHKGFYEENEIRFGCLNRLEKDKSIGGGYHNQSPYQISIEAEAPRLKIDFLPSAVKKIIIGPQSNQDKVEILIRHHLESNGYKNIEIIKSSIPFIPNKI